MFGMLYCAEFISVIVDNSDAPDCAPSQACLTRTDGQVNIRYTGRNWTHLLVGEL